MTCRLARLAPSPRQILDALARLRKLERLLNAAEAFAVDCQGADHVAAGAHASFFEAELGLADLGRRVRRDIDRLERLSRGVAYTPGCRKSETGNLKPELLRLQPPTCNVQPATRDVP